MDLALDPADAAMIRDNGYLQLDQSGPSLSFDAYIFENRAPVVPALGAHTDNGFFACQLPTRCLLGKQGGSSILITPAIWPSLSVAPGHSSVVAVGLCLKKESSLRPSCFFSYCFPP